VEHAEPRERSDRASSASGRLPALVKAVELARRIARTDFIVANTLIIKPCRVCKDCQMLEEEA
jgi:hypothetical protein